MTGDVIYSETESKKYVFNLCHIGNITKLISNQTMTFNVSKASVCFQISTLRFLKRGVRCNALGSVSSVVVQCG